MAIKPKTCGQGRDFRLLSRASGSVQPCHSFAAYPARMTQWEVRNTTDALSAVYFGGTRIRRVPIALSGQVHELLLHEDTQDGPYLLAPSSSLPTGRASISLNAEWGEPLGRVDALHTHPETGRVEAYVIVGPFPEPMTVDATDTYWWQGELYCRKRRATQLRDLRRQASRARPAVNANSAD